MLKNPHSKQFSIAADSLMLNPNGRVWLFQQSHGRLIHSPAIGACIPGSFLLCRTTRASLPEPNREPSQHSLHFVAFTSFRIAVARILIQRADSVDGEPVPGQAASSVGLRVFSIRPPPFASRRMGHPLHMSPDDSCFVEGALRRKRLEVAGVCFVYSPALAGNVTDLFSP